MVRAAPTLAFHILRVLVLLFVFCKALTPNFRARRGRKPLSSAVHAHGKVPRSLAGNRRHQLQQPHLPSFSAEYALLQKSSTLSVRRGTAQLIAKVQDNAVELNVKRQSLMRTESAGTEATQSASLAQTAAFLNGRRKALNRLKLWIFKRTCMVQCGISRAAWDRASSKCKSDCVASLQRLVDASHAVRPAEERHIQFPQASSASMQLHDANDKTHFNSMMFAGGVQIGSNITFVARLCTHNCYVKEPFYDSTLILGQLEHSAKQGGPAGGGDTAQPWSGDGALQWKHAMEHWIPHDDGNMVHGEYVGPEDPRLDVLQGRRFLTVGMNLPRHESRGHCNDSQIGMHHQVFVPVDHSPRLKTCDIRVPGVDPCGIQKNWASLVPRGSNDIYYIYSIKPLQVVRFQPENCDATWVAKSGTEDDYPKNFNALYDVHGGTRYIFGGQVAEGELFWSVGHTPRPFYMPVLVGMLIRNATGAQPMPSFELLGVSCPIKVSRKFGDRTTLTDDDWGDHILITTSIVDFDPVADVSTVTFQVHDKDNYQSKLSGVGAWLQTAYKESRSGSVFSCDNLHDDDYRVIKRAY